MQDNRENFLDSKSVLAIIFLIVSWLAWNQYMKKKYPPELQKRTVPVEELKAEQNIIPKEPKKESPLLFGKSFKEKTFKFKGENMEIIFSSKGLGIKQLKLNKYYSRANKNILFHSLEGQPLFSSWFFKDIENPIPFEVKRQGNVFIGVFSSAQGSIKKKVTVLDEQQILIGQTEIIPKTAESFKGLRFVFSHPLPKEESKGGFFKMLFMYGQDVFKAFVSYEGKKNQRLTGEDFEEEQNYKNVSLAAIGNKYFGQAFINDSSLLPSVFFKKEKDHIQANVDYEFLHSKKQSVEYKMFLGPKSLKNFQKMGGDIQEWVDFGFFDWLAGPILLFLNKLYDWCRNWGLAIILLTFFIRICLLPINIRSYKSMKVMQKIQPQIKELREKHKKDPKTMNIEVMALMKKHKANPLGGCLPLFIQFPVFFALYRVLAESIELYQSPFVLWIKDLSLKDPYYVLPVLGGLVLFIQQKITPMNLPKEQARLLTAMPLLFSVFMLGLPSGLTLYIFVSGLFGLIQQFFFVRLAHS